MASTVNYSINLEPFQFDPASLTTPDAIGRQIDQINAALREETIPIQLKQILEKQGLATASEPRPLEGLSKSNLSNVNALIDPSRKKKITELALRIIQHEMYFRGLSDLKQQKNNIQAEVAKTSKEVTQTQQKLAKDINELKRSADAGKAAAEKSHDAAQNTKKKVEDVKEDVTKNQAKSEAAEKEVQQQEQNAAQKAGWSFRQKVFGTIVAIGVVALAALGIKKYFDNKEDDNKGKKGEKT